MGCVSVKTIVMLIYVAPRLRYNDTVDIAYAWIRYLSAGANSESSSEIGLLPLGLKLRSI